MKLNGNIKLITTKETINLKEAFELYQEAKNEYDYLRLNIVDNLKENEESYFDEAVNKMGILKELKGKIKEIENYQVLKK